jgi:3-oxoacyl-[acyl-carrier-protein] synthase III
VKNIDRYGNTTATTIPLAMGRRSTSHLALMAAVGPGFRVGSALLRWTGFDWK